MSYSLLRQRIKVGVAYLDEHYPDWYNQVDIEEIKMWSSNLHLLQFVTGVDANILISGDQFSWAIEHGFTLDIEIKSGDELMMPDEYIDFNRMWIEEIRVCRMMEIVDYVQSFCQQQAEKLGAENIVSNLSFLVRKQIEDEIYKGDNECTSLGEQTSLFDQE